MLPHRALLLTIFTVFAGFLALPDPGQAQIQDRSRLVSDLDLAAAEHAADSMVAGVAVAVVEDEDTLLLGGYGVANLEHDVPTPPDAVFEVGSITKQFTAAAVLQLAAEDSLDLDASITEYLPDYDTRGHWVTVRQLLHHTSGIRSYTGLAAFPSIMPQRLPRDTVLSLIEAEPFRFAPGTAMSYSNTGYFLLGFIIEQASGQSYSDYLEEHLLEPAGMEDTRYCDERAVVEHGAQGYSWSAEEGLRRRNFFVHWWPYAAGSLCSTAGDLVAWNRALHDGGILPDSMYHEMTTPGHLKDGTRLRYGAGLVVSQDRGREVISHGGAIPGFLSEARFYPDDDLVVVVLQNTIGPRPNAMGFREPEALADSLVRLVLGPGDPPRETPYDGNLQSFTGRYSGPAQRRFMELVVNEEDGRLVVRPISAPPSEGEEADTLTHTSGLTWRTAGDRYRFVRSGNRIVELHLDVGTGHYILRKVDGD